MKLRIRRPYWTFFWCLPLLAVLGHDIYVFFETGHRFYFSETGYLLQHYTHWHDRVVHLSDAQYWRDGLKIILNAKAAIVAGLVALPAVLWLNRPARGDHGDHGSSRRRRRR